MGIYWTLIGELKLCLLLYPKPKSQWKPRASLPFRRSVKLKKLDPHWINPIVHCGRRLSHGKESDKKQKAIYQRSTTKRLKNTRIITYGKVAKLKGILFSTIIEHRKKLHGHFLQFRYTSSQEAIFVNQGYRKYTSSLPTNFGVAHKANGRLRQWNPPKHFQQATNHENKDKRLIKWIGEQLGSNDSATKLKCYESTPIQTPDCSNTQSTSTAHHLFTPKKDNK